VKDCPRFWDPWRRWNQKSEKKKEEKREGEERRKISVEGDEILGIGHVIMVNDVDLTPARCSRDAVESLSRVFGLVIGFERRHLEGGIRGQWNVIPNSNKTQEHLFSFGRSVCIFLRVAGIHGKVRSFSPHSCAAIV